MTVRRRDCEMKHLCPNNRVYSSPYPGKGLPGSTRSRERASRFWRGRKVARTMSLLNLVHQSVVMKFTDAAKPQFDTATGYVFRLAGVDGMGFLQLQDLRLGPNDEHETISEPYWINKDLVREIHEYASATGKDALKFTGERRNDGPPSRRREPKSEAALISRSASCRSCTWERACPLQLVAGSRSGLRVPPARTPRRRRGWRRPRRPWPRRTWAGTTGTRRRDRA